MSRTQGTNWTGPLGILQSDGSIVEFIDESGNLIADVQIGDLEEILDANGNEILEFDTVAAAVNHIRIANAATGNAPVISIESEDDIGIEFHNNQGEELLVLSATATAVNQLQIANSATNNPVDLQGIGDDANVGIKLTPKGVAGVTIGGTGGLFSSASTKGYYPFVEFAAAEDIAAGTGGAISITTFYTTFDTDAGGDAFTLADGVAAGQLKKIQMITDGGGDGVLTPDNLDGGTTITFADAGDFALLGWDGSSWIAIELGNAADGVSAPVLA